MEDKEKENEIEFSKSESCETCPSTGSSQFAIQKTLQTKDLLNRMAKAKSVVTNGVKPSRVFTIC
jgi:hypothetical protein